jgi:3-phenylpropionate/trans-cinnamate dioxygenase ferredoxin reductase component
MTNECTEPTVIVGGGHAAGALLTALIQNQYANNLVLVGEEPYAPYQRPPLSKNYLSGDVDQESLYLKPQSLYESAGFNLRLGVRVEQIDRIKNTVYLSDQTSLRYNKLVLATGSRVRHMKVPGSELEGIYHLQGIADSDVLKEKLCEGKRLVIVGGGYIGLEVAAVAVKKGLAVTLLEASERLLQRVTGPEVSEFYYAKHSSAGVDIRLNSAVTGFEANGCSKVAGVRLEDGSLVPADLVLVSVGVVPETTLAQNAGIACDDGILVDEYTQTNDQSILAIGDCTRHRNLFYDRQLRVGSVANAVEQARTAAETLAGTPKPLNYVPWFWSNQYDVRLQMVGLSEGYDERVVRGNISEDGFSVFYIRENRVVAVDAINNPQAFLVGKQLVSQGRSVNLQAIKNLNIELRSLVSRN